jgi:hypothetical protein
VHSQDWLCHKRVDDAEDGVVVGFGAAAGEDNFLGTSADERGDLFAGRFDGGAGALAGSVDGGGVGEVAGEIGKHGVEDLRVDGRRGVVIEIDAVHGVASLRIHPNTGVGDEPTSPETEGAALDSVEKTPPWAICKFLKRKGVTKLRFVRD